MTTDEMILKAEMAGLEAEVEGALASYIEIAGWEHLFEVLSRLAEKRRDARIGGIMMAALNFLSEKG